MTKTTSLHKLGQLILAERSEVLSVYFYAILSGLVQLSIPLGVQAIIGFVIGASMVVSIYVLIALVVLSVFAVGMMQVNQMRIIEKIQQRIFTRHAFAFAARIPALDLKEMDNYYLPEKVNRFFDTLNIQKGLSKLLLDIPAASIQILFGLVLLSLYNPVFIVFSLLLVALLWAILYVTGRRGLATSIEESNYKYSVAAWLQEMARFIKSFKFNQQSDYNLLRTDSKVLKYLGARTSHFRILLVQYKALVFFKVCITSVMLIVGTWLLLNQQLNIGEFIAAEIVILTVISAVEKLITSLDSAYDVVTGLEKIAAITESPLEKEGTTLLDTSAGVAIELRKLTFSYTNSSPVLQNISFSVPAHSLVCISGNAGSGKSSLLKLFTGCYSDFQGALLINQLPLQHYQLQSLRSQTGIYLNRQELFDGTVLENIARGNPQITTGHIIQVARAAGLDGFISTLPDGFNTAVDTTGKKIPGTVVKKILLLRAFVHHPAMLLLEEPWQGLEAETKASLMAYLQQIKQTTTILLISNDQDIRQQCDLNIRLQNGELV